MPSKGQGGTVEVGAVGGLRGEPVGMVGGVMFTGHVDAIVEKGERLEVGGIKAEEAEYVVDGHVVEGIRAGDPIGIVGG